MRVDRVHSLCPFLRPNARSRFALIILNVDFASLSAHVLSRLWLNAAWRICADGGANCLFDLTAALPDLHQRLIPNIICGDLDSARPDVLDFYRSLGTRIEKSDEQYTNDLTKALLALEKIELLEGDSPYDILMIGSCGGGRLDHVFANFSAMFAMMAKTRMFFMVDGNNNASTILPPGLHRLDFLRPAEQSYCGLIPLGQPCTVSTSGLKWDMIKRHLKFGTMVSTSNELSAQAHDAGSEAPSSMCLSTPSSLPPNDACAAKASTNTDSALVFDECIKQNETRTSVFIHCDAPLLWCHTVNLVLY